MFQLNNDHLYFIETLFFLYNRIQITDESTTKSIDKPQSYNMFHVIE